MAGERAACGDRGDAGGPGRRTVLTMPRADRLVVAIGLPLGGLLLGGLLPAVSRAVLQRWHHGLPLGFVLRLFASVDEAWELVVAVGVGAIAGLGIAAVAFANSVTVRLTDAALRLERPGDDPRTIARADVDAVFLDGKTLVVLDRQSRQLASEPLDARPRAVEQAFVEHGFPWADTDPYAGLYRAWSPATPGLPGEVNAVLAAREVALRKKARQQACELRTAVEKLGFTVRDEGTRQHWRPLVRSS